MAGNIEIQLFEITQGDVLFGFQLEEPTTEPFFFNFFVKLKYPSWSKFSVRKP
jgi:hypothetical protein